MEGSKILAVLLALSFGTLVSTGPCSTDPDAVIQGSCTLAATIHNYNNLVFGETANVSVLTNTTSGTGVEIRANNITILVGAVINGVGLGCAAGSGIGRPNISDLFQHSPGAGHSGDGGEALENSVSMKGSAYGLIDAPVYAGSGGGSTYYQAGSAGGGAIHFNVSTYFIMNGKIDMSGLNGTPGIRDSSGGSGGSIWVEAQSFSGTGAIICNGGSSLPNAGGSSAGRIAIHIDVITFTGTITAQGGSGYEQGAPGTVYVKNRVSGVTKLTVDNGAISNRSQAAVVSNPSPTVWNFDQIELRRSGHVHFRDVDDTVFIRNQSMLGDSTSKLYTTGTINATTVNPIENFGLASRKGGTLWLAPSVKVWGVEIEILGFLRGVGSLEFRSSAGWVIAGSFILTGTISVQDNSYIKVLPDLINNKGVSINCADFNLAANSNIFGDGYPSQQGPGAGSSDSAHSTGAGHSGDGGRSVNILAVGTAYGRTEEPVTLGSGGGSNYYAKGGKGGGAIKIVASNQLTINGIIDLSGQSGTCGIQCSGGGAGGSIWLDANLFSGIGTLRADGGSGGDQGGGGSAGRIAIYYNTYSFTGTVQGFSGPGYQHGAPATVLNRDNNQMKTELGVTNRHIIAQPAVVTSPATTNYQFDRITLTQEADLQFRDYADKLTITPVQMGGDSTGQLCSYGTVDASAVASVRLFGLCSLGNGNVIFPQQVTINAVTVTIGGSMQNVSDLYVTNGGNFEATGTGRTFGQTNGSYQFVGEISLEANSNIILTPDTTIQPSGRGATFSCGTFNLGPGCSIKGAGRGYAANLGPGKGNPTSPSNTEATGGGHSGYSGRSADDVAQGVAYGSLKGPVGLGSGGGSNFFSLGGSGGAAVKITATWDITIDGLIDVSGLNGTCNTRCSGGGSGGSIWLETAQIFSGSGTIRNNGGGGGLKGGGGSAGRIAIYFGVNDFAGTIEAYAGSGYEHGGRGTIYYENQETNFTTLYVDNNGFDGQPAIVTDPAQTNHEFSKIILRGFGHVLFSDSVDTVTIQPSQMDGDNTAQLSSYGTINAAAVSVVSKFGLGSINNGQIMLPEVVSIVGVRCSIIGRISQAQTITLKNGANLELYAAGRTQGQPSGLYNWLGNLTLESNSRITVIPDLTGAGKGISVTASKITLSEGTNIGGVGFGSQAGPAPGNGVNPEHGSGAAHSGDGGKSPTKNGGIAYGVFYAPISLGSGGGMGYTSLGGSGGAAIRLTANTTLTIDGKIDMSGGNGVCGTYCSGGGSGGSIWIEADVINGHGSIVASGGSGNISAGGGSAGRIAYFYTTNNFTGTIRAAGGTGFEDGGAGTIYMMAKSGGFKRLTVDNEGLEGPPAVATDSPATLHLFNEIVLKRNGNILFRDFSDTLILRRQDMFGDGTARLCSGGVLNATTVDVITNFGLCSVQNGVLYLAKDVTFQNTSSLIEGALVAQNVMLVNAVINLDSSGRTDSQSNGNYIFDSFIMTSQSQIISNGNVTLNKGITITSQLMSIDSSSKIVLIGFPADSGPGKAGVGSAYNHQAGGGHGGKGGNSTVGILGGDTYGDANQPTTLGSGGGTSAYSPGGAGGGAIKLQVNNFGFYGRIEADGENGRAGSRDSGGGAGGSVWIDSSCAYGSGVISAKGGNAPSYSDGAIIYAGGGGGGRIRVDISNFDMSQSTMSYLVNGGAGGAQSGSMAIAIHGYSACMPTNPTTNALTTGRSATTATTNGQAAPHTTDPLTSQSQGELPTDSSSSDTTTTESQVSSLTTSSDSQQNRGSPLIIGVSVAVVLLVAIGALLVAAFFRVRRRRQRSLEDVPMTPLKAVARISEIPATSLSKESDVPVLQNIEVGERLGSGNFGEVFLGTWNNGSHVALKKLKESEAEAEFEQELAILFRVGQHPSITRFLGKFTSKSGEKFFVFEFLPKGSLLEFLRLKKGNLKTSDLIDMILSVTDGMLFLESKNVLHRDLSCRNLLVTKSDGKYSAKISDFGMSRYHSDNEYNSSNKKALPVRWCAPEVILFNRFSGKSEVWSFGVTCWEILSFGAQPFAWLSNKEVSEQVASKGLILARPETCPAELWDVIEKCFHQNPDLRPSFRDISQNLRPFGARSPSANRQNQGDPTFSDYSLVSKPEPDDIIYNYD